MKKLILAAAALMVSLAAYGQGQFVFNNRALPDVNAQFKLDNGTIPGSDATPYTVQLWGGPAGSASSTWTELATTTFRTGNAAGYVNPITVTVPGATTAASVEVRLFNSATTTGTPFGTLVSGGTEQVFNVPVAVAPNPPGNMPLGTTALTFTTVPEPSTLALAALGLGSMLFIRRRK
jgi:hypothetical protein